LINSLAIVTTAPAYAQVRVGGGQAPAATPAANPYGDYVALGDFAKPCIYYDARGRAHHQPHPDMCDTPEPLTPAKADSVLPTYSHDEFIAKYWQLGEEGYQRYRDSNRVLCNDALSWATGLQNIDTLFQASDEVYKAFIDDVYSQLPDEVRLHTRVMQIAQAAQAGLLCVLSAGLYCIAVVVGAVGNIFSAESSLDLQLANIRLSVANSYVTRLNIWLERLDARLMQRWVQIVTPFCVKIGIVLPTLPPMPPLPPVPDELKAMIPAGTDQH
jgi:hypothetical protein